MPIEVQGHVLPLWKPPINIFWDKDYHGCCSTLNICQAILNNRILLNKSQYASDLKFTPFTVHNSYCN